MAQAHRWLWGLIPVACLWLVAALFETAAVEKDLSSRTVAALASGAWIPASILVEGRDVTLGGESYDAGDRGAARTTTNDVHGVRLVDDASHPVPPARPYSWSAVKTGSAVTLSGHVPKPLDRTKIFATSGASGSKVTDTAVYAGGAPPDFTAAAARLGLVLGELTDGSASIEDRTLSIKGVARDTATRDAAEAALGKLPAGFTLRDHAIQVPAYAFTAAKDAAAGTVTFDGTLPDNATRETLLGAARRMFVGQTLVDRTTLQAGAPNGFAASVTTGLEQLSRLDGGTLKVADQSIDLSGSALYDRAVGQIRSAMGNVAGGFAAKTDVTAKPPAAPIDPAACQQRFNELLASGTVQFETGSARIDKASAGILDHLVGIAEACPAQMLEISGHTDAAGNDAFNMDLSKQRAQAVVAYVVAAGVDASHLTAVGYGKTKPIASNDTDEGRAKNRRIEFLVK